MASLNPREAKYDEIRPEYASDVSSKTLAEQIAELKLHNSKLIRENDRLITRCKALEGVVKPLVKMGEQVN